MQRHNGIDAWGKLCNIIFEENETDVMKEVLKQLSKYYIEEILKMEM